MLTREEHSQRAQYQFGGNNTVWSLGGFNIETFVPEAIRRLNESFGNKSGYSCYTHKNSDAKSLCTGFMCNAYIDEIVPLMNPDFSHAGVNSASLHTENILVLHLYCHIFCPPPPGESTSKINR